ncbi:hypothetical protein HPB47_010608, partial [Ixodes persulcatus]
NNNTMNHSTANDHSNKANILIPTHQQVGADEKTAKNNNQSSSHLLEEDGDD